MLFPTAQLMPFDLIEDDDSNAGDKRMEQFNIDGAIGVQLTRHMALGHNSIMLRAPTPSIATCDIATR